MHIRGHRGSGRRPTGRGPALTPQLEAAAFERALEWRREWRAEVAARAAGNGNAAHDTAERPQRPSKRDGAKFAAEIARAEFGRFYWDAKRNQLPAAQRKRRPPK